MTTGEKIKQAREKQKLTQGQVASLLNVNTSTYYKYETGVFFPRPETLTSLAKIFKVPVTNLMGDELKDLYTAPHDTPRAIHTTFDPEKMYTYVKGFAAGRGWTDVLKALAFVREKHAGQTRKSGEPYIIHPLTMACHALALGLEEQAIITACLYHDVPEDCDVDWRDLPIDDPAAKNAVRLLTHVKPDPLESYYREIAKDPIASIVKLLDRCDNVSTMAGVFKTPKLMSYIEETRTYNLPLWRSTKDHWPQYSNALFVLKYHIVSVINGLDKVVTIMSNENEAEQLW